MGCALPVGLVEFGFPFSPDGFVLDEQRSREFLSSTELQKHIPLLSEREFLTSSSPGIYPSTVVNRLFLYLTHREAVLLILRFGLMSGSTKLTLAEIKTSSGKPMEFLRRVERNGMKAIAYGVKDCGPHQSWRKVDSIKVLGLCLETEHLLFRRGVVSVDQLRAISRRDLALMRKFGPTRVREVTEALERFP